MTSRRRRFSHVSTWAVALVFSAAAAVGQSKSFKDQDLTGRDLSGQNLNGADFSGATLTNTNFRGSSMRGAIFRDAQLRNANFSRVDCTECDFRGAIMPLSQQSTPDVQGGSTLFVNANFEGLDFKGTNFYGANLNGANLKGTKGIGSVTWARMRGADVSGADLVSVKGSAEDVQVFSGAIYDDKTAWPRWVDPEQSGAQKK